MIGETVRFYLKADMSEQSFQAMRDLSEHFIFASRRSAFGGKADMANVCFGGKSSPSVDRDLYFDASECPRIMHRGHCSDWFPLSRL